MLEALFVSVAIYVAFVVVMIQRRRKQSAATMANGNFSNRSWDSGAGFIPGMIGGSFGAGDYSGGGSRGSDGGSGGSCS